MWWRERKGARPVGGEVLDYDGAFRRLGQEERYAFLDAAERLTFAPGQVIVRTGSPASGVYVVLSGVVRVQHQVRVVRRVPASSAPTNVHEGILEKELARLGEGTLFGEMSFLDGLPASATVAAVTRVETARITHDQVNGWVERDATFAGRFFESLAITLALRLRAANRRIANIY